jgi:lipoyl(octanoyl) transferase
MSDPNPQLPKRPSLAFYENPVDLSQTNTVDWGRTGYAEAFARQETYVKERIDGVRSDTLIITEHHPVFTVGRRKGSSSHLIWDEQQLNEQGIEVEITNRGGDITYHGPGQIVGYPIIDLSQRKDLHRYLRDLEEVIIKTLAHFGLFASRREGMTGIWLEKRKIAAMGIAVKHWTTYHGFALNVTTDLNHFSGIVPCGITDGTVTSMEVELGYTPDADMVKRLLEVEFWGIYANYPIPC